MRFTYKNSLNDILNDPYLSMCMPFFYPSVLLDVIERENRDKSLDFLKDTVCMSQSDPYNLELFLNTANRLEERKDKYIFLPLWGEVDKSIKLDARGKDKRSVCLTALSCAEDGKKRPAVIICPGGGYVSIYGVLEGLDIADRMEQEGWRPFILDYRLKPNFYPAPQLDLMLAIKYIRANAEKYLIDADNIMILGFSAGGHLCATQAALWRELEPVLDSELKKGNFLVAEQYRSISARPDKVCLNYACIKYTVSEEERVRGKTDFLMEKLSADQNVRPDYPKTFLWICEDDPVVNPEECRFMDRSLTAHGVNHLCRIYPSGGHGIGLGEGTSAENWMNEMLQFMGKP